MEQSGMRDRSVVAQNPDFASLHPGYELCWVL
jgi:hypothetical protein